MSSLKSNFAIVILISPFRFSKGTKTNFAISSMAGGPIWFVLDWLCFEFAVAKHYLWAFSIGVSLGGWVGSACMGGLGLGWFGSGGHGATPADLKG